MLLSKGFEIELYTGTPDGQAIGLSDRIVSVLDGFVREPDSRNVEYTTAPLCNYDRLLCDLLGPRQKLRRYLKGLGNYTVIPGSTLSLGGGDRFWRSDPANPYHDYIEQTYGTKVVTASVHINLGLADHELLMRACRLVRVEAPLYLALSAASPFMDGHPTGYHSTRWMLFPQTPDHVPLFESHAHFVRWTEEQLAQGTMQNVRHLWSSVRPNGDCRPYKLNRLELRICDLIIDPIALLAVTALIEGRLRQLIDDPSLDPLVASRLPAGSRAEDLLALTAANESAAARDSLGATLRHWQDGRSLSAVEWIGQLLESVRPVAQKHGFGCFLSPLNRLLREGNEAQQWLAALDRGHSPAAIIQQAIRTAAERERELSSQLCQSRWGRSPESLAG